MGRKDFVSSKSKSAFVALAKDEETLGARLEKADQQSPCHLLFQIPGRPNLAPDKIQEHRPVIVEMKKDDDKDDIS